MKIPDPWHLGCEVSSADLAQAPWETAIVSSSASALVWPGTDEYVSVDCGDFGTCARDFLAAIWTVLYYDDTASLWGPNMGFADYLVTTSAASSRIRIAILNPDSAPSSATHDVDGRIEYTALDCGEIECPFYLANVTLSNTEDTWELYSEDLADAAHISDISFQLRRPTLGVWNTSTNQVYLGAERADIYIFVTHQVGSEASVEGGYLVTNADAIFGKILGGGGIEISNLVVGDGAHVEFEADLVYDTIAGGPPTADHGMSVTVIAPTVAGLPLASITDASWDPDDDIDSKIWLVDGVQRLSSYIVPIGIHEFALRVIDARGATDVDTSIIEVLAP